jgi:inner membrane protein
MRDELTVKTLITALTALLLLAPLAQIRGTIAERQNRQETARRNIASMWSHEQAILSPIVIQPYTIEARRQTGSGPYQSWETVIEHRIRLLDAQRVEILGAATTERRYRGIYSVPVYTASLSMAGEFSVKRLRALREGIRNQPGFVSLDRPMLAMALSDQGGVSGVPGIRWNSTPLRVLPGSGIPGWSDGVRVQLPEPGDEPGSPIPAGSFSATLELRGMETLRVVPAAARAEVSLSSPWPHPEFIGAFLPAARRVARSGFSARWSVTEFNTLMGERLADCETRSCDRLIQAGVGVRIHDPVNVYLLSERATKYGILFIGLVFSAFLVMEATRKLRVHPVQYAFTGLALALFFLLLIALGEHLRFAVAYWTACAACIAMLGGYMRHLLRGRPGAGAFSTALAGIYALIYVILQAEDYSLLAGSILAIAALAMVLIATRNVDWYRARAEAK